VGRRNGERATSGARWGEYESTRCGSPGLSQLGSRVSGGGGGGGTASALEKGTSKSIAHACSKVCLGGVLVFGLFWVFEEMVSSLRKKKRGLVAGLGARNILRFLSTFKRYGE